MPNFFTPEGASAAFDQGVGVKHSQDPEVFGMSHTTAILRVFLADTRMIASYRVG